MAVPFGCKPLLRPMCLASNVNTEDLRSQLDQLHAEAETTRAKASNARLRLLRLSEAAEKLRRQASISVQKGMENDARELLFQKKKVMQALDKSKSRIEVLDKLSAKLNEAISAKETQLIESIASDLEGSGEDVSNPIRIISPQPKVSKDENKDTEFGCNDLIISKDQNVKFYQDGQLNQTVDEELAEGKASSIATPYNEDNMISSSTTVSSCEDFLEHLDQQLQKIEQELIAILNVSTLVLDNGEKPKNLKVQQTTELLDGILHLRQRITNIRQTKIQTS
ncbi:hypothetical protein SLEP1_g34429 [Rubroshorea leprosula]|uniref:Uncharacterized protein n=1 Tax=Rubroshorea leprosula TaxID=152421 RepID=A0AAV5KK57_9ROSI|nr:hypothetical protein SLEP1_g34429 [Rubroshorea leprosula]